MLPFLMPCGASPALLAQGLEAAVRQEACTPLADEQPLWRVLLLRMPQGKMAIVLTIHHCIGDGSFIATMLMKELLTSAPPSSSSPSSSPSTAPSTTPSAPASAAAATWPAACMMLLSQPAAWLLQARSVLVGKQLRVGREAPLSLGRSATIEIGAGSDVGAIRRATGATVTDILLAAFAACVRSVELRASSRSSRSAPHVAPLLTFMPAMAGSPDVTAPLERHTGNTVSGYMLSLPADDPSPLGRLRNVRRQSGAAKAARIATVAGWLARVALRLAPRQLLPQLVPLSAHVASCCGVSSFRGPPTSAIDGATLDAFYFYGLFTPPRMPLMVAFTSVGERLRVTLVMKGGLAGTKDVADVLHELPHALNELRTAVTKDA